MKWIGLTGGIATGKSTVAMILRDLGLPVVDADQLAREVVRPGSKGLAEVIQHFGPEILHDDGTLNRAKLGHVVFQSEAKRKLLEAILHPKIQELRAQERRSLEQLGVEIAFYDVPLLFEKNMEAEFDATILVFADEKTQRERLQKRDNLDDQQIAARIQSQMPIEEKKRRATYILFNDSSLSNLKHNLQTILNDIQSSR